MNRGGWVFFPSRISDPQQEKKKKIKLEIYTKSNIIYFKKKRNMKYLSDFQIRKS